MDTYTQKMVAGAMMDDEQSASRMMEEEAPVAESADDAGWVVDTLSIKQAKNGGWIVTCSKHKPIPSSANSGLGAYESNDYTFTSLAEAVPFIEREFRTSAPGGGGAPAPAPTPRMR